MVTTNRHSYRQVELAESVADDLAAFIDELNLDPAIAAEEARVIVSTLLAEQLRTNREAWLNIFQRTLHAPAAGGE